MIGEKTEERRLFTREERLEILKKSYGICACCGKKLTTKTLRVEHVIRCPGVEKTKWRI